MGGGRPGDGLEEWGAGRGWGGARKNERKKGRKLKRKTLYHRYL